MKSQRAAGVLGRALPWLAIGGLVVVLRGRRMPSAGATERAGDDDPTALVTAYHSVARAELVERISRRDMALFLYLAAAATVATVLVKDYPRGSNGLWEIV